MKNLFISLVTNGKSDADIYADRHIAIENAKRILQEDVWALDTFLKHDLEIEVYGRSHEAPPLWYLSESIKVLSEADVAYFCKGWQNDRQCRIEHDCALKYGIDRIIYEDMTYEN